MHTFLRAALPLLLSACLASAGTAHGAAMAAADQSGGYAGKMLHEISEIWAPPPGLKGDFEVRLKVAVDGRGAVEDCALLRKSGLEALDISVCGAVRHIGKFGGPPYGMPLEVHLTFWTGTPKGRVKAETLSEEEALRALVLARAKAEGAMAKDRASGVEEKAKARAEAIAKDAGQPLPDVEPAPVAPLGKARPAPARKGKAASSTPGQEKTPATVLMAAAQNKTQDKAQDKSPAKTQGKEQDKVRGKAPDTARNQGPAAVAAKTDKTGKAEKPAPAGPAALPAPPTPPQGVRGQVVQPETAPTTPASGKPPSAGQIVAPVAPAAPRAVAVAPASGKPAPPLATGVLAQDKYDRAYRKYLAQIAYNLRDAMFIPAETTLGIYYATVRMVLEPTGVITKFSLLESSGDPILDRFVLQGIRRAGSVEPPPSGLSKTLDITFTLVRR